MCDALITVVDQGKLYSTFWRDFNARSEYLIFQVKRSPYVFIAVSLFRAFADVCDNLSHEIIILQILQRYLKPQ